MKPMTQEAVISLSEGLRQELRGTLGVKTGRILGNSNQGFGVFSVEEHVCNVFIDDNGLGVTVVKSGAILARLEGDRRVFDLQDPISIPSIVEAVRGFLGSQR